jgi:putative sterol carrier protein
MGRVEESLAALVAGFRPEAARGVQAVFELELSGDGGGKWHLKVSDGKCELGSGPAQDPNATISMSAEDWGRLMGRELDVEQAFSEGRIRVTGSLYLAMQLGEMFGF